MRWSLCRLVIIEPACDFVKCGCRRFDVVWALEERRLSLGSLWTSILANRRELWLEKVLFSFYFCKACQDGIGRGHHPGVSKRSIACIIRVSETGCEPLGRKLSLNGWYRTERYNTEDMGSMSRQAWTMTTSGCPVAIKTVAVQLSVTCESEFVDLLTRRRLGWSSEACKCLTAKPRESLVESLWAEGG